MMDYVKSEWYRLQRKAGLYSTYVITLGLVIAAVIVLNISLKNIPNFPYGSSDFLFRNVLSLGVVIIWIGAVVNSFLTGKDKTVMKHSVAYGNSRNKIFLVKLGLTLGVFLLLCLVGTGLATGLGNAFLQSDKVVVRSFLIAAVNMIPLVISGFALSHTLLMLNVNEMTTVIILFVVYDLSDMLISMVLTFFKITDKISQYFPSALFSSNYQAFIDRSVSFSPACWLVGAGITILCLVIGLTLFNRKIIK